MDIIIFGSILAIWTVLVCTMSFCLAHLYEKTEQRYGVFIFGMFIVGLVGLTSGVGHIFNKLSLVV